MTKLGDTHLTQNDRPEEAVKSADLDEQSELTGKGWKQPLALGLIVFIVHSLSPTPQSGDSRLSTITAWQFFRNFDLHLEGYPIVEALTYRRDLFVYDDHLLPYFPWPTMLLAGPGGFAAALFGHSPDTLSISDPSQVWLVEVPTASLMVAITAVVIRSYVLGLNNRWSNNAIAWVAALVFAFGTSAWSVGSRALWQQTASMLFLALALLALQRIDRGRQQSLFLGLWLGLALVMRPTNAIAVAFFVLWLCLRRRRSVLVAGLGFAAVLLPFLVFSRLQYGQFIPPYYLPNRFEEDSPFSAWESLWMNLISPSRGLLVYNTVAVLAVFGTVFSIRKKTFSEIDGLMVASCVAQLVAITSYGSTGGSTYGPRLMIDILPFLVLLAVPIFSLLTTSFKKKSFWQRLATIGVVLLLFWGVFVNATGALMRSGYCWSASPVQIDEQPDRVWDWSDPQFLRPYADILNGRPLHDVIAGSCSSGA